jgi:hypothetical protein
MLKTTLALRGLVLKSFDLELQMLLLLVKALNNFLVLLLTLQAHLLLKIELREQFFN